MNALETAVPRHVVSQDTVRDIMADLLAKSTDGKPALERAASKALSVYDNAGIDQRYVCQPTEAFLEGQTWAETNQTYLDVGTELLVESSEKVLSICETDLGFSRDDIAAVVCCSTTGIATPSLPSQMLPKLGLKQNMPSMPIFGYGCAGGVLGMRTAKDVSRANGGKPVLLLTMELCSLAFRLGDATKKGIVSTALFGDGGTAAIVSGKAQGPCLVDFDQMTWPDTADMMGWDVDSQGFGLVLARDIPSFVTANFTPIIAEFLERHGLKKSDLAEPACHPGGRKVVEAIEEFLAPEMNELPHTREVLRSHGNMSSPTVHFVLKRLLDAREPTDTRPILMTALGPGFTGAVGLLTFDHEQEQKAAA